MSLRVRLFLMIASMVLLLVLAQWWWVGSLTRELAEEVDSVALQIGNSVAEVLIESVTQDSESTLAPGCPENDPRCRRLQVMHKVIRRQTSVEGDVAEEETAEDRTWVFHSSATAEASNQSSPIHDRAAAGSGGPPGRQKPRQVWVGQHLPKEDGTGTHQLMTYSFDIAGSSVCADGDTDCTEEARAILMFADSHGGQGSGTHDVIVDRHLALHLNTWAPDDETVAVATAHSPRAHDPAAHGGGESVRLIPIPGHGIQQRVARFSQRLLFGSGAFLVLGLLAAALVAQRVSAPLRSLSAAAEQVGQGALGTQVENAPADPDVGRAITAFNRMSGRLASLDRAHRELAARQHLGEIGEIARGLAHTLRNPLNALGLSLEEIAARASHGEDAAEETHRLVAGARRQIRRADHSIRSFLALASHGGEVEAVDLAELARDVALEAIQDAGRRVLVEVDAPHPAPILAIAPELRAVLQALVVNAVEASPDDQTVAVAVSLAATATPPDREDTAHADPDRGDPGRGDSGSVRLTVADRGPGLPEAIRERLFTPHQTTKAQGSGMGLFLAYRIATTRYGGSLRLDPRDGGGTLAVLTVRARREGDHDQDPR